MNLLFSLTLVFTLAAAVIVQTPHGAIQGLEERGLYIFKGIPYGESTARQNRWKPPVPKKPWIGILEATEFGSVCPQPPTLGTEDCLFLNIWMKQSALTGPTTPVLIWIHGGGFAVGSGSDPIFNGSYFATTHNLIVVTINYRLGALGFLNGPKFSGNYGILDQQEAFRWVQANIRYFGGNPNEVTIAGQSAGAMSVMLHLVIKSSWEFFHRAIIESPGTGILYRDEFENYPIAESFAHKALCKDINDEACLRSCLSQTIIAYQLLAEDTLVASLLSKGSFDSKQLLLWAPTIDKKLIMDQPLKLLATKNFKNVPIIWGHTQDEGLGITSTDFKCADAIIENWVDNMGAFALYVHNTWSGWKQGIVVGMYLKYSWDPKDVFFTHPLNDFLTEYLFVCPTHTLLNKMTNHFGYPPIYFYYWKHPEKINPAPRCANRACHSVELPYVFHTLDQLGGKPTTAEWTLSEKVANYWGHFILGREADLPEPRLQPWNVLYTDLTLFINDTVSSTSFLLAEKVRAGRCALWERVWNTWGGDDSSASNSIGIETSKKEDL